MKKELNWPSILVGYYAASRAGVLWRPYPDWNDWVAGVADVVPRPDDEIDIVVEAGLKVRPRPLAGLNGRRCVGMRTSRQTRGTQRRFAVRLAR
jgi:hypothetical protein